MVDIWNNKNCISITYLLLHFEVEFDASDRKHQNTTCDMCYVATMCYNIFLKV